MQSRYDDNQLQHFGYPLSILANFRQKQLLYLTFRSHAGDYNFFWLRVFDISQSESNECLNYMIDLFITYNASTN